jgi:hypothetical protein
MEDKFNAAWRFGISKVLAVRKQIFSRSEFHAFTFGGETIISLTQYQKHQP